MRASWIAGQVPGMTEPAVSSITLTAASAAIASTVGDALGLDPTMIIWGFLGALLLVSRESSEDLRVRRAILIVLGGAVIAGGLGGLAMAAATEHFHSAPVLPLKIAIGVLLGIVSQAIVAGASGLVSAVFVALGERIKKLVGGK